MIWQTRRDRVSDWFYNLIPRREQEWNPNDLWEAFPDLLRYRAFIQLSPPDDPHTGLPRTGPVRVLRPPLERPGGGWYDNAPPTPSPR
jgi:hypothetical protein